MFLIREMARGDAAAVLRLAAAFSQESGVSAPAIAPTEFARMALADAPLFEVFVAEPHAGGAPVGYLLLTFAFELRSGAPGGRMEDLYVAPAQRRKGVGRGLVAAAGQAITARGGRWMEWRVAGEDANAMAFYTTIGARAAAGRVFYLGPGETRGLARAVDPHKVDLR